MPAKSGMGIGHADAIACLQKVFAKNHTGFGVDSTDQNIDPGNLQYGEITYQGMQPLYSALELGQGDVFYDLGCGVGKLVLYVALRGDAARSVGLEVGQRRFLLAEGARCSLDEDCFNQCLLLLPTLLPNYRSRLPHADTSLHAMVWLFCLLKKTSTATIATMLEFPRLRA